MYTDYDQLVKGSDRVTKLARRLYIKLTGYTYRETDEWRVKN